MSPEEFTKTSYDYVVIGGGTAGLVVAARLSENPDVTVAVLEAGGNKLDDPLVDGPNLFIQLWDKPEYDWSFKTVPQVCVHHYSSDDCLITSIERNPGPCTWLGTWKGFGRLICRQLQHVFDGFAVGSGAIANLIADLN
jgi:hypothetical protein